MPPLLGIGKKLWSWISPQKVEVRLVSRTVPSGQLEVWPEFWLGGRQLNDQQVGHGTHFILGYRVRVPNSVQEIRSEFQGRRLRLRPRAVADWVRKYSAKGVAVVDQDSGRTVQAHSAKVEFDVQLNPDDT
jgi:hypothetical protein